MKFVGESPQLARGEWRVLDTDHGWTLYIRPRLGGMFWAHVVYSFGWLTLGATFALSTPFVLVVVALPIAPAAVAAWNLANNVVVLRVEDGMGSLGVDRLKPDYWRTLRIEHLTTMQTGRPGRFWLVGLWFLELRSFGRVYGADYFGPLEFVSYGSRTHFGGALPDTVSEAICDAVASKLNSVAAGA